jgi:RNase P/RNase MRP subunit POP5
MIKNKKLKLKPSARDKRRYFLTQKTSHKKIKQAILEYIGILGLAKSAYMEVNSKEFPNKTIGSCLSKSLDEIRISLALKKIKIERVSGTIKGLKS